MQMTALVKGSVQEVYEHCFLRLTWLCMQGAVPYIVELYGQSLTRYFSELKPLNYHLLCCNAHLEIHHHDQWLCDRQTDGKSNYSTT